MWRINNTTLLSFIEHGDCFGSTFYIYLEVVFVSKHRWINREHLYNLVRHELVLLAEIPERLCHFLVSMD